MYYTLTTSLSGTTVSDIILSFTTAFSYRHVDYDTHNLLNVVQHSKQIILENKQKSPRQMDKSMLSADTWYSDQFIMHLSIVKPQQHSCR